MGQEHVGKVIDVGGEIRGIKTIRWTGNLIPVGANCFLQSSKISGKWATSINTGTYVNKCSAHPGTLLPERCVQAKV